MRINIEIDDDLLKEAMKITKLKSKKVLVNYALREYIILYKRNFIAGVVKLKENGDKKESNRNRYIKKGLSEEEKYQRRVRLLSLQGKVKWFN